MPRRLFSCFVWIHLFASVVLAQDDVVGNGIPVTNQTTRNACSSCHAIDNEGRMTRISFMRKTPEGWQETIKRMVREQDVVVSPDVAREIVRYLSNDHGLAPEEARPAFYEVERRMIREVIPDESLEAACVACHSIGRILSQRRDRDEWELLTNFHLALYPLTEFQAFRGTRRPTSRTLPAVGEAQVGDDPRRPGPIPPTRAISSTMSPDDQRDPVDRALDYLGRALPLDTPEWRAWRANFRVPRIEGTWAVQVYMVGKGRGYGQMVISPGPSEDEFRTETTIEFGDGTRTARTGRVLLYAGYSWRGSSNDPGARTERLEQLREVMFLAADSETLNGRWFNGAYDEFGIDVVARRVRRDIHVSGTDKSAVMAGSTDSVRIYGANFTTDLSAEDIDFGPGVTVDSVRVTSDMITVDIAVASEALPGQRDVVVGGIVSRGALAVFDTIDYVRVLPEQGMARLGGGAMPKQFQQFDAVAYHEGPDGMSGTDDDIELGAVPVTWSVEEFHARLNDDDILYVGTLGPNGLFTPNIDGPNPERKGQTNNYGDVRVIATYGGEGTDRPIRGGAHLVVTVPLYVRWLQLEVLP